MARKKETAEELRRKVRSLQEMLSRVRRQGGGQEIPGKNPAPEGKEVVRRIKVSKGKKPAAQPQAAPAAAPAAPAPAAVPETKPAPVVTPDSKETPHAERKPLGFLSW